MSFNNWGFSQVILTWLNGAVMSGELVVWDQRTKRLLSEDDVWFTRNGDAIQVNFSPGEDLDNR